MKLDELDSLGARGGEWSIGVVITPSPTPTTTSTPPTHSNNVAR